MTELHGHERQGSHCDDARLMQASNEEIRELRVEIAALRSEIAALRSELVALGDAIRCMGISIYTGSRLS